jgi:hypothetical protein
MGKKLILNIPTSKINKDVVNSQMKVIESDYYSNNNVHDL